MATVAHPFGSAAQKRVARYLEQQTRRFTSQVVVQQFSAAVPTSTAHSHVGPVSQIRKGRNILAKYATSSAGSIRPSVILGAHYDTKDMRHEGFDYLGANDGASATVLLLQLLAHYSEFEEILPFDVVFVWFDGEESVLPGWGDWRAHPSGAQDNTYGSRHLADSLKKCGDSFCAGDGFFGPVKAVVVVDMISDANLALSEDLNSTPALRKALAQALTELDGPVEIAPVRQRISDDHLPFLGRKIPSLLVIDFMNTSHWHRPTDTVHRVSLHSMEQAGRILARLLKVLARESSFAQVSQNSSLADSQSI